MSMFMCGQRTVLGLDSLPPCASPGLHSGCQTWPASVFACEHLTGLVSILCKARAAMPAGKRPWEDIALWAGVFWALPCG